MVNYGKTIWLNDYTVTGTPARHSAAQSLLLYDYGTPADRKSVWLKYNAPFVDYRPNFSGESYAKAKSRYNNGFVVVPIDGIITGPTAVKTALSADVTLLTPPDEEAFDVVLYFDHSKVI
jgi:hypothetical protein